MTGPDPREARLPRWAQQQLTLLRRNLDAARTARGEGPEGSNVHLAGRGQQPDEPLGYDVGVVFDLADGGRITVRLLPGRGAIVATLSAVPGGPSRIAAWPVGSVNVLTIGPLR